MTPSASRLTGSLRDIGYDLNTTLADLVDNSLSAGAAQVDVEIVFDGTASYLLVADDGAGMSESRLTEALRFGTRRGYAAGELGRYGLGLKTASIAQGRRLTVVSRQAPVRPRLAARTLDLDVVERDDRWEVFDPGPSHAVELAHQWLVDRPGTVVVIEGLDRVLPDRNPAGGWARRRLATLAERAVAHLGMVFHRYIEGEFGLPLTITVNGEKSPAWNPFAPDEDREALPVRQFEVEHGGLVEQVKYSPFVLPPRRSFSSPEAFERMAGPDKWNRQQGLYIYRAGRMIQSGGWSGMRAADEHTKLARAAVDFSTELDEAFKINVAKMRVSLPAQLRALLTHAVQELCNKANAAYRRDSAVNGEAPSARASEKGAGAETLPLISARLLSAATAAGEFDALSRIMATLRQQDPALAESLGW